MESGNSLQTFSEEELAVIQARRTAFIARFIVLRESKRTRAHRIIERLEWPAETSVEQLSQIIREIFISNGDNMEPVERDIRRAISHSSRSLNHFIREYATRATTNFIDSLEDYERSNSLLFGEDEYPKPGGWRLPHELRKSRSSETDDNASPNFRAAQNFRAA